MSISNVSHLARFTKVVYGYNDSGDLNLFFRYVSGPGVSTRVVLFITGVKSFKCFQNVCVCFFSISYTHHVRKQTG